MQRRKRLMGRRLAIHSFSQLLAHRGRPTTASFPKHDYLCEPKTQSAASLKQQIEMLSTKDGNLRFIRAVSPGSSAGSGAWKADKKLRLYPLS